jgi:SAM-dependent methyltransferase
MNSKEQFLKKVARGIYKTVGDYRDIEYKQALKFFKECDRVLDVGCGTGGFLELLEQEGKKEVIGIDFNPECVDVCLKRELNAKIGDALDIPFEDNRFDGAYCSHVMHVFNSSQAITLIKEMSRVVRPNGIIAITTVPMYERFFFDAADVRPWPPAAIRNMLAKPKIEGHVAPTISGLPPLTEIGIWLRRPALFSFNFQGSRTTAAASQLINQLQYFFYLRKYWNFNGYIMALRNTKEIDKG